MCSTIALKRPGTTLPILQAAVIFVEGLVLCCLVSLQVAPAHSSSIIPVTMVTGSELSQTLMVQLPSQSESKKPRVGQLRETQRCSYCVECFYTYTHHTLTPTHTLARTHTHTPSRRPSPHEASQGAQGVALPSWGDASLSCASHTRTERSAGGSLRQSHHVQEL